MLTRSAPSWQTSRPPRAESWRATRSIGAFAFALLQELFKSEAVFGGFAKHWHLGLGLTIIASVALLPRGLVGLPTQWRQRLLGRPSAQRAAPDAEVGHGR